MKHQIRCIVDTLVDDDLYISQGPVDQLANHQGLDAGLVMAMRFVGATKNVEGVELVNIETQRWKPHAGGRVGVKDSTDKR